MNNWYGLLKVLEIQHIRDGKVIWEDKNLNNLLHTAAEEFFLKVLFGGMALPTNYFMGLDARATLDAGDTMETIVDEPLGTGYLRQQISASTGWDVQLISTGTINVYRAVGNIVTFQANGGSWGPVTNLFMTDKSDNTGVLLSTVLLSQAVTLGSGDAINMRMSLSLRDYPLV